MHLGQFIQAGETGVEISEPRELPTVRYFLGYCLCGKKIVIGPRRAAVLARMFVKRGIDPRPKSPFMAAPLTKLANLILKTVDKDNKTA